jgi:membrane protein DedA with SNARE-associated domain
MKTLENFFEKTHLLKVFLFGWILFGGMIASIFYGLFITDAIRPELNFTGIACVQIGLMLGLVFGAMIAFFVGQMRKSQEFWDHAKRVESLIDKAESKSALESIRKWEFESLREMSQGGPHNTELYRLHAIMQTKHKYVNQ